MYAFLYLSLAACICHDAIGFLERHCRLDCNGHGSCHEYYGREYCQCDSGYTGNTCQHRDHCNPNPCQHHGRCHASSSHPYFTCTCNFGYLGNTCQYDHCASSPCKNGGECRHSFFPRKYYTCHCQNGYSGDNCEVSACDRQHCMNGGECHLTRHTPHFSCSCINGYSGDSCQYAAHLATTDTPTTVVPTTTPLHASTLPNFKLMCSKISSVIDIAEKVIETNQAAAICPSGNRTSPEAFVLNNCGLTPPSTWKQGYNVMTWCKNIPPYTPVASFQHGMYDSVSDVAGIFIGCLQDNSGFTFAEQSCDQVAAIGHIDSGNGRNPDTFFTIEL